MINQTLGNICQNLSPVGPQCPLEHLGHAYGLVGIHHIGDGAFDQRHLTVLVPVLGQLRKSGCYVSMQLLPLLPVICPCHCSTPEASEFVRLSQTRSVFDHGDLGELLLSRPPRLWFVRLFTRGLTMASSCVFFFFSQLLPRVYLPLGVEEVLILLLYV